MRQIVNDETSQKRWLRLGSIRRDGRIYRHRKKRLPIQSIVHVVARLPFWNRSRFAAAVGLTNTRNKNLTVSMSRTETFWPTRSHD